MEKIGLIPAAGMASRLGTLPCSKEMLPLGYNMGKGGNGGLKVVSQYLLEKYRRAGIKKVYTIIRKGKWDIPAFYGDGSTLGLSMAYLMMSHPYGVPYSLDQAYPFVRAGRIFLGFPDILFEPENAFTVAEHALDRQNADVLLGLCAVNDPKQKQQSDMVQLAADSHIQTITVKPRTTRLHYTWLLAVWNPLFSRFMHDFLKQDLLKRKRATHLEEIHLGHVIQQAIENGLRVYGHVFKDISFYDVGNTHNLLPALQHYFIQKAQ